MYCCKPFERAVEEWRTCTVDHSPYPCADEIIRRFQDGRFVIVIHDGGSSGLQINWCPWCGAKLPGAGAIGYCRVIDPEPAPSTPAYEEPTALKDLKNKDVVKILS